MFEYERIILIDRKTSIKNMFYLMKSADVRELTWVLMNSAEVQELIYAIYRAMVSMCSTEHINAA